MGGVLLDWNPRHLYRKLIPEPAEMERFLATVPRRNGMACRISAETRPKRLAA